MKAVAVGRRLIRVKKIIPMFFRSGGWLGMVMILSCCDERVTRHYPTRREAEADRLFAKGWLPDKIPASSRDIITRNDLDVNISEGEFSFDPAEATTFATGLRELKEAPTHDEVSTAHLAAGYRAFELKQDGAVWIFFIHHANGHCAYTMWAGR